MKIWGNSKKCVKAAILALSILLLFVPAVKAHAADSGTCGDKLTWTLSDDGTLTISGTGAMTDYTAENKAPWIKSYYDHSVKKLVIEEGVTSLGNYAFYRCNSLGEITFAKSLTSIGERTFGYSTCLYELVVPDSITSIGAYAFEYSALGEITLPNSITVINDGTFSNCGSLKSITVPGSVTSIGKNAFTDCGLLEEVTIPNSVNVINESAFSGCSGLSSITLPNSVTQIDDLAFESCMQLKTVVAPGVKTLGNKVFTGCANLSSMTFSDEFTAMGSEVFNDCTSLTKITGWTVDNKLTTVTEKAFANAPALTELHVPRDVKEIKQSAFEGCVALKNVGIPAACRTIEVGAYSGCPVTDVYYEGTKEQWEAISIGASNESLKNATMHYESYNVYPPTGVFKIDPVSATVEIGATVDIIALNTYGAKVIWTSDNAAVAEVDDNGVVIGQSVGTTKIWATLEGTLSKASCDITVNEPVPIDPIRVDPASVTISIGKTTILSALNTYDNKVIWSSDNNAVVAVQQNGIISGVGVGTTKVWAKIEGTKNKAACDVTVKEPGPDPDPEPDHVVAFVSRMYSIILERNPEEGGLQYWTDLLRTKQIDGAGFANGVVMSAEYINKNDSDEIYVTKLYRTFLNREPDAPGYADWVHQLKQGYTRKKILKGFVNSLEFTDICAAYGIDRGTMELTDEENARSDYNLHIDVEQVKAYVTRLYNTILERDPDETGFNDWLNVITTRQQLAATVAKVGFFESQEYAMKNRTNEEFVRDCYHSLLGREPEEAGYADWVGRLSRGEMTRAEVIETGFGQSEEFFNILRQYGLKMVD